MPYISKTLLIFLAIAFALSCDGNNEKSAAADSPGKLKVVKKKRGDGTLQSASQVDAENFAHGLKVNYYEDGKTVHSKITFNHGVKQGPAVWYYRNSQIFEHTGFSNGKREGLTKKYHKNGKLLSQCEFSKGEALPGLVEYAEDGSKIRDHPVVKFRKIDKIAFENRLILEISSSVKSSKVKYYHINVLDDGQQFKSYIPVKAGVALLEYYVAPGKVLMRTLEIYAELPTKLGNTFVKKYTYQLSAKNIR